MPTSSSPVRRGRPPKGALQLTRTMIVEATLAVIDSDGVGSVSMRSIARFLRVDAKSLYNHVDGKGDLLDAVAESLLGSIVLPVRSGDPRADLRAVARAFRASALAHPEAASLVLTRQLPSFDALAPTQVVLEILRAAGCDPRQAVHLLRALVATLIGTLLREVNAGPAFGTDDTAGIALRQEILERSALPAVSEAAAHLARFDREAEYEYTIELALDMVLARCGR